MLRIRKLRHKTLKEGYIYASAFDGLEIKKFYLCVWDSDFNMANRALFVIRANRLENSCLPQYALVLKSKEEAFYQKGKKYTLRFSKTSNVFDKDGFFWSGAKGHSFQIQSREIQENFGVLFFPFQRKNHNTFFFALLETGGQFLAKSDLPLESFLEKKWDVSGKGTYGFSIYLQSYLQVEEVRFGDSVEMVYRFDLQESLPDRDISLESILYEYKPTQAKPKKPKIRKKEKLADEINWDVPENNGASRCYVMDPKDLQHKRDIQKESHLRLDMQMILKDSIQKFIENFGNQNPQDEDYYDLVEQILEKLERL